MDLLTERIRSLTQLRDQLDGCIGVDVFLWTIVLFGIRVINSLGNGAV